MLTDPVAIVRLRLPCLFLLCLFVHEVNTVNLVQCGANLANEPGQSNPPSMTYTECVETCGGGAGDFQWTMFSQSFGSWLLPWLALIFQLPFGATSA